MRIQLARWGNSTGLRVPSGILEQLGLKAGSHIDLIVSGDVIELRPIRRTSRQLLDEMVAEAGRLGPAHEPETVEWGPDRGSEIIDDIDPR